MFSLIASFLYCGLLILFSWLVWRDQGNNYILLMSMKRLSIQMYHSELFSICKSNSWVTDRFYYSVVYIAKIEWKDVGWSVSRLFTLTHNGMVNQWKLAGWRVQIWIFEAEAIPFVTCKSEEGLGSFCRNLIQSSQPMNLNMEMYTRPWYFIQIHRFF